MSIGSLFSGIGGLELGLEAAGLGAVAWQVEIDPFCRRVLAKHWPDAARDVCDVRVAGAATLAPVDVICGGFPCQDVSAAGKRAGLEGERSGLWYEYRRIVSELRPRIVVVENVASGAPKWLPTVRRQLCELGYNTTALAVSAEDVGAPHRRARVFVVGLADPNRQWQPQPSGAVRDLGGWPGDGGAAVADTKGVGWAQGRPESSRQQGDQTLPSAAAEDVSGTLNPAWVEVLMGFPLNWTDIDGRPDEAKPNTPKSRPAQSRRARSPTEPRE